MPKNTVLFILGFAGLSMQIGDLQIEKKFVPESCSRKSEVGDTITWFYRGLFVDGMEFHRGNYTAQLGAKQVITGVDQGMRDMCVGEKRKLTIPHHLAYGVDGTQGIPGKSTLIFEVELYEINRPSEDPDPRLAEIDIDIQKEAESCPMKSSEGDRITWHYVGTLTDGTLFDRGEFTAVLGAGEVITGVDLAMRGMCVGDKRKMRIPSHLAYGEGGVSGVIPGGATLIFEVELTNIERKDKEEL